MKKWTINSWRDYPVKHIPKYEDEKELTKVLKKVSSFPFFTSTGELLGLENCPAILPIFTTGNDAEKVKTKAICKITLNVSLILSG